jgi:hypothetical protein
MLENYIIQDVYYEIFQKVENLCWGQLLMILNNHQSFIQDLICFELMCIHNFLQ